MSTGMPVALAALAKARASALTLAERRERAPPVAAAGGSMNSIAVLPAVKDEGGHERGLSAEPAGPGAPGRNPVAVSWPTICFSASAAPVRSGSTQTGSKERPGRASRGVEDAIGRPMDHG